MELIKFSKYSDAKSKDKIDITVEDYIKMIKDGTYQDLILNARANKSDKAKYSEFKAKAACITGSAVMNIGSKDANNIHEMNGIIVLDIDSNVDIEIISKINNDPYTFISHRSFGGDGVCVFVKINPVKFLESFNDLGQYYWDTFNLVIDVACKNNNRVRFVSYDQYIFQNDKSKKFTAKSKVEKKAKKENFIFVEDDFSNLINQITSKGIDLCQDNYERYVSIGFAIGSKFKAAGLNYFKAICQNGSKYDEKNIEKHYSNFCKKDAGITIATLYYYAKQEGVEIYSEATKRTISCVNVQKSQGTPTIESVKKTLKVTNSDIKPNDQLIKELIESKVDYSKAIPNEETEVNQLKNFISENFTPSRDGITNEIFINGKLLDDVKLNSIYFSAKNCLDFAVNKSDVRDMINSEATETIDPLKTFFATKGDETGVIDSYADCIHPNNDYNKWAFKKWIVGSVHNWMSPVHETKVSPLTLVLCGQKQGTGKTSFFRHLLPLDLKKYLIEHKIDGKDKDSIYNLVKGLLVLDDEFGGLATKDVKDFKKIADVNMIDIRLPYSAFYTKLKRKASICGTSNDISVLKDVTGNRRILPINVNSIDYNKMILINADNLWREAFQLWKNDYDWKIYSAQDIDYLESNTVKNIEVMPVEELFFNIFSLEKTEEKSERKIMSQGELLDYLTIHTSVKPTKYDIKDIFIKNKMEYKVHRVGHATKKGIELWVKGEENSEFPF